MADHTGGMIALVPSDPDLKRLAVDGGEPPDELHLTLAYLGDDVTDWGQDARDALHREVQDRVNGGPIQARVMGHAQFNPDGGPDGDADPCMVYMIGDTDRIAPMRNDFANLMANKINVPAQHEPYLPHVTAGYGLEPDQLTYTGPITFDRVRVALGNDVTDYPLTTPQEDTVPEQTMADTPGIPVSFPVLAVEGLSTSDGRYIEPGALDHRPLPLPILAQTQTPVGGGGHDGAHVIGRIDTMHRVAGPTVVSKVTGKPFPDGTFVWSGSGYIDPDAPATGLAKKGYLTGNSVDLSEVEAFIEDDPNAQPMDDSDQGGVKIGGGNGERMRLTKGVIAATTLVPIPAFADAYVELDGQKITAADGLTAAATPPWRSAELGDDTCLPCAYGDDAMAVTATKRKKAEDAGHAMPGGRYPIDTAADLDNAIRAVGRAGGPTGTEKDRDAVRRHIITQAKRLGLESKIPDTWNPDGTLKQPNKAALIAATNSPLPPITWFRDPGLPGPTPLTVDDDGRVYGHLAAWNTCHTGFTGRCVLAPRSRTDYAYFRTGAVRVWDGQAGDNGEPVQIGAGKLTVVLDKFGGDGHAPPELAAMPAAAHYDNAGCAVADVEVGEDAHGIWVAGALRSTATPEQVDALLAAPLSGDWRPINGHLELVAALGVNTPGFPLPRARVASGQVVSLVAAGALPRTPAATPDDTLADAIAVKVAAKLGLKLGPVATDVGTDELAARRAAALKAITDADLTSRRLLAVTALEAFLDGWDEFAPTSDDVEFARRNWVQKAGGLPKYIKRIAKHLREKGMDESRAIATAVNAAKKMCATGDVNFPGKQQVNPGSKAEACAAVADWERKKAQS